ncbi:hypothetical protein ACQRBF_08135, partial [Peptoniphilaceae bacterium SGI.131]
MKRNLSKKIISVFLALVLTFSGLGLFKANEAKAAGNITLWRNQDPTWYGGSAYFRVEGMDFEVICENPSDDYATPILQGERITFTMNDLVEVTDVRLKKYVYWFNDYYNEHKGQYLTQFTGGIFELKNGGTVDHEGLKLNDEASKYHLLHFMMGNINGTANMSPVIYEDYTNWLKNKSDAPSAFKLYRLKSGVKIGSGALAKYGANANYQNMLFFNFIENQELSLKKTSKNKNLTDIAKAGYSIKGAEYGVYGSNANAKNN